MLRSGVSVTMRLRLTVSVLYFVFVFNVKLLTFLFDAFRRRWDERACLTVC